MVEDLGIFDPIEEQIADELDHDYLNDYFEDEFRTTAENLALWIFGRVNDIIRTKGLQKQITCNRVKLYETERSGVIMEKDDWKTYRKHYENWKERTQ
jgi:6-pyruvoyl-tetrahydropterin synthase